MTTQSGEQPSAISVLLEYIPIPEREAAIANVIKCLKGVEGLTSCLSILPFLDLVADKSLEADLERYILSVMRNVSADCPQLVDLCQKSSLICNWVLEGCIADLQDLGSSRNPKQDKDEGIPQSKYLTYDEDKNCIFNLSRIEFISILFDKLGSKCLQYELFSVLMNLLLDLFRSSVQMPFRVLFRTILVASKSILNNNDSLKVEQLTRAVDIRQKIWQTIQFLCSTTACIVPRAIVLAIWLCWLEMPSDYSEAIKSKQQPYPWPYLQNSMRSTDIESRKCAITILRRTMQVVVSHKLIMEDRYLNMGEDEVHRDLTIQALERYCTVYETIMIGRYLNQIKDCMPDLSVMCRSKSVIPVSWLSCILEPALSVFTQEGVRSLVGNWILDGQCEIMSNNEVSVQLLRTAILPWATSSHMFTNSIRGAKRNLTCGHGNRLVDLIAGVLKSIQPETLVGSVVDVIVEYMASIKFGIMPHVLVYLTRGLKAGLEVSNPVAVDAKSPSVVLDLPATPGFSPVVRDILIVDCFAIAQELTYNGDLLSVTLSYFHKRFKGLELQYNTLCAVDQINVQSEVAWKSIDELIYDIKVTKHKCLQTIQKLHNACLATKLFIKTDLEQTISAQSLHYVLDALWQQIEREDFPKQILLEAPEIWLHHRCLKIAAASQEVLDDVINFVGVFNRLCVGKVYLWTPYMSCLRRAILNFPVLAEKLDLQQMIMAKLEDMPTLSAEFKLEGAICKLLAEECPSLTYEHYHGADENIGMAFFFDMVNRLSGINLQIAQQVCNELLDLWATRKRDKSRSQPKYTIEQLQTLLILIQSSSDGTKHLHTLLSVLKLETSPRYRYLLEWMSCTLIVQDVALLEPILTGLSANDHHDNPKYLASLIKIAVYVAYGHNTSEDMAKQVSQRLIVLSASAKIVIRHEAQWSLSTLWNTARAKGWYSISTDSLVIGLLDYIRGAEKYNAPPLQRQLSLFNYTTNHNLAHLLCGPYLSLDGGMRRLDYSDLLRADQYDEPSSIPAPCMKLGVEPSYPELSVEQDEISEKVSVVFHEQDEATLALQTKGASYLIGSTTNQRHDDLIVVASLVDNPYNLGGLSRVSEIFGASKMYISNLNTITNKEFKDVAVSSHDILSIEALQLKDMLTFFSQKKCDGFSIVGIEQTDRSKILGRPDTIIPRKAVLVLGSERDGMPAQIMAACDILIEIPQKGTTRSLNVQTAAASVLYEFNRQHSG